MSNRCNKGPRRAERLATRSESSCCGQSLLLITTYGECASERLPPRGAAERAAIRLKGVHSRQCIHVHRCCFGSLAAHGMTG